MSMTPPPPHPRKVSDVLGPVGEEKFFLYLSTLLLVGLIVKLA